jgi:hypothetical protein
MKEQNDVFEMPEMDWVFRDGGSKLSFLDDNLKKIDCLHSSYFNDKRSELHEEVVKFINANLEKIDDPEEEYEDRMSAFEVRRFYLDDIVDMIPVHITRDELYSFLKKNDIHLYRDGVKTREEYIKKWCELALTRTKNVNTKTSTSYGLKHICEDAIGDYVSNEEMIDVLTELGFKKKKVSDSPNYHFNISKVINKVVFSDKLFTCYNDSNRVFNSDSYTVYYRIETGELKMKKEYL